MAFYGHCYVIPPPHTHTHLHMYKNYFVEVQAKTQAFASVTGGSYMDFVSGNEKEKFLSES